MSEEQRWRETQEALVRVTLVLAQRGWIWDETGLIEEVTDCVAATLEAWRARRDAGEEGE
jgi:hypothetical protein